MKVFAKTSVGGGKKHCGTDYYVFMSEPSRFDGIKENIFSLLAVGYSDGVAVDYSFIFDLCRDEAFALDVLEKLRKNRVMPCHVKDVVLDLL